MTEKYPSSHSTLSGLGCKPMECKVYYVTYVESLEQQIAMLVDALKNVQPLVNEFGFDYDKERVSQALAQVGDDSEADRLQWYSEDSDDLPELNEGDMK